MANLSGTALDDLLFGLLESDNIVTLAGNDTVDGGGGNDTIDGGDGDDFITTEGGTDLIRGGLGNDEVSTGEGKDTIYGGDGNDSLFGGGGNDVIYGDEGANTTSELGNDSIDGGAGDDLLFGDTGDDIVIGSFGSDFLSGGAGNDTLSSHNGREDGTLLERDRMNGGVGADVFNLFTNYTGGTQNLTPKPEGSTNNGLDNSLAIIEGFVKGTDTLNLRLGSANINYQFAYGSFEGKAIADTIIRRGNNVVAVVVDVVLGSGDVGRVS